MKYNFKYEHQFNPNMSEKEVFDLVTDKLGLTNVKRIVRLADPNEVEDVSDFLSECIEYAEYNCPDFDECDYMESGRVPNMYSVKVEVKEAENSTARFWDMQIVVDAETNGIIGVSFCNGSDEE